MRRRPPRSTLSSSSAASDVYKRQGWMEIAMERNPELSAVADRMGPLGRAAALYQLRELTGGQLDPRAFTRPELLGLVAEFLETEGMTLAAGLVEVEARRGTDQGAATSTKLYSLLHAAVSAAEKVYEAEGTPELEGYLERLGLQAEGMSIWEEKRSKSTFDLDEDEDPPTVDAGTFNQLVVWLMEHPTETQYASCFYMNLTTFSSAEAFLAKCYERYFVDDRHVPRGMKPVGWLRNVRARVLQVLTDWLGACPWHMTDRMALGIDRLVQHTAPRDGLVLEAQTLAAACDTARAYRHHRGGGIAGGYPRRVCTDDDARGLLLSHDPHTTADHLTMLLSSVFSSINPMELLDCAWEKKRLEWRSPNVRWYARIWGHTARWAQRAVLTSQDAEAATQALELLVGVSRRLLDTNNFASLRAVHSALVAEPMARLTQVAAKVPGYRETLDLLKELFDLTNKKNYNKALREAKPPVIPYLGDPQGHLVYAYDGNNKYDDNGLINMYRYQVVYKIVAGVLSHQRVKHEYPVRAEVMEVVKRVFGAEVEAQEDERAELMQHSFRLQPCAGPEPQA
eukprot:TRINITY_DN8221_c0_g1_i2.p1 TRINITY_DN8221_c0_g1~~TRINITY_DN8221_c0_g1_i2.p1  ORF type:complete len:568 (-),score=122.09 TRINITY_DN8221_c0_g1_i2:176-1879(-)